MSELHSMNLDVLAAEVAYRHGTGGRDKVNEAPRARRFWVGRKTRTG